MSEERRHEFRTKLQRLREAMQQNGVEACRLDTQANLAWLGCGAETYIPIASVDGAGTLLVTFDNVYLIADNIEAQRLLDEEFFGLPIEPIVYSWPEGSGKREALIQRLAGTPKVGADTAHPGTLHMADPLYHCRASLLPAETERYRALSRDAEAALRETCFALSPGMTEFQIGALLAQRVLERGIVPYLILVAVDERISRYRHPIPTNAALQRTAMVVLCARRAGLIANCTRMVHFGPLPEDLRRRHAAVCAVDAELNLTTRPGATFGEIFQRGVSAYAEQGFADEWRLHHQGGPTGYMGRDWKAIASSRFPVVDNQAVAWNPSITGTKVEDTILATVDGPQILTAAQDWPMLEVQRENGTLPRPDILVR